MSEPVWTREAIQGWSLQAVFFGDGAKGSAIQQRSCVECPEIWQTWERSHHNDPGRVTWGYNEMRFDDLGQLLEWLNDNEIPFPEKESA